MSLSLVSGMLLPKGLKGDQKMSESAKNGRLDFKVSEKGGVSVYGLGRFPVTLYYEQWTRLLGSIDALRDFIETNKPVLKMKDQ